MRDDSPQRDNFSESREARVDIAAPRNLDPARVWAVRGGHQPQLSIAPTQNAIIAGNSFGLGLIVALECKGRLGFIV